MKFRANLLQKELVVHRTIRRMSRFVHHADDVLRSSREPDDVALGALGDGNDVVTIPDSLVDLAVVAGALGSQERRYKNPCN